MGQNFHKIEAVMLEGGDLPLQAVSLTAFQEFFLTPSLSWGQCLFITLIKCHKSQKSLFLSIFLSSTHFITDPDLMFLKSHHSFCNVKQPKLQARTTIGLVYTPATFFMFFFRTILVIYPDRVNFHYLSVQQIDKVGRCLARYSPRAEANNPIPCNTIRYNAMT